MITIEYMHGLLRHRAEKLDRINQLICTAGPGMLLEGGTLTWGSKHEMMTEDHICS